MNFNSTRIKLFIFLIFAFVGKIMAKCGREQFSHEILYLADGQYYSHYLLAREMAKILNENYCVTFLIATYEGKNTHHVNLVQEVQNLLSEDIKAILLPIDQEYENSKFYTSGVGRLPSNWDQENITTNLDIYWKMTECRSVTFFQTVIKNVPVYVDGRDYGIFEWLKHQNYQLGIAEIGIEKTIATTATPAIPVFYHFLGLKIPIDVPEHYSASKGDGLKNAKIRIPGSPRQIQNNNYYNELIRKFTEIYDTDYEQNYNVQLINSSAMPLKPFKSPRALFSSVKYFLVNHSELAAYPRDLNNKIKFIGGIAIGDQMLENYRAKDLHNNDYLTDGAWNNNVECVGFLSIGTLASFNGIDQEKLNTMYRALGKHPECHFLIRIDRAHFPNDQQKQHFNLNNVEFINENIPQQEILAQKNTKIAIIHCGQNSLTEALYAGVPVICIPLLGDQRYNASVVEYLQVGIWVQAPHFHQQFEYALNKILKKRNVWNKIFKKRDSYKQNVKKLARRLNDPNRDKSKEIFLQAVRDALNDDDEASSPVHNEDIQFEYKFGRGL